MAKKRKITQWESTIDGQHYTFAYERVKFQHTITINDETQVVKGGFLSGLLGFDEPFTFDGKSARLAQISGQMDVAYNGTYLNSGKKYVPRPAWVWIFAILCLAIPIITAGGAIPAVIGFGGAMACVALSKTELPTVVRVFLCIFATGTAWLLLFLLGAGMMFLTGP